MREINAAEAEVRELRKSETEVKSETGVVEAALLKVELGATRRREAELATCQSGVIRTLAERIFRSKSFSALVLKLAGVINSRTVSSTLDEVASDYPDLDKDKYRYEVFPTEEVLRNYAEVLLEQTEAFQVVEALASCSTLLSATEIQNCLVDRNKDFEVILAEVAQKLEHPELRKQPEVEERTEDEAGGGQEKADVTGTLKSAEVSEQAGGSKECVVEEEASGWVS